MTQSPDFATNSEVIGTCSRLGADADDAWWGHCLAANSDWLLGTRARLLYAHSRRVPPPDEMVTSSGIRRPVSPSGRLLREAPALFFHQCLLRGIRRSELAAKRVGSEASLQRSDFVCPFRPGPVYRKKRDTTTAVTSEQPDPMSDAAELSSITTVLADLQTRVVEVADRWREIEREDVAGDLYDVERSIRNAQRRIRRAVQGFDR